MKRGIVAFLLILGSWANLAKAATLSVPGNYSTIQAAINAAVNGDEVVVANGTYSGSGNIILDFKGKAITVRSANGPQNCTINCNGGGNAFYFSHYETADSVVDGFTITGGSRGYGGAIDCLRSSPTIKNCIIQENDASDGGGIDCYYSSPTVINCVIKNNEAHYGGGIFCFNSSPTIMHCVISGNIADYGGGIEIRGSTSSPVVKNCLVSDNTADFAGGGFDCYDSNPQITNCTIVNNYDGYTGGGIYSTDASTPSIQNCILWHNGGDLDGSATAAYSCIEDGDGGVGNISSNPLFRTGPSGDYYFSQQAAGQLQNSDCFDTGSDTAENQDLAGYTTRTDDVGDSDTVDMGYHYPISGKPVIQYQLNSSVFNGNGSINPSGVANYNQFSEISLIAVADTYYKIKKWTLNGYVLPMDPIDPNYPANLNYPDEFVVTMNSNKVVTVEFETITTYQLTTEVKGLNGTISPASGEQYQGYPVTVTAYPDEGYRVFGWYIDDVSVDVDPLDPNHCEVFMDSDKKVTVMFATNDSDSVLRISIPTGHGQVSSGETNPFFGDIYPTGTVVELTAHPDAGYKVAQWIGTDNDSTFNVDNTVTLTYSKDISVRFDEATQYWLDTDIVDSNGDVSSDPKGTIEPRDSWQAKDADVVLTAEPAYGYIVERWWIEGNPIYPDPYDPNHYTVTMYGNSKVGVEFSRRPWLYTSVLPDINYGSIAPGSGPRNFGDIVTITATPASGYKILNWVINGAVEPLDPNDIINANSQSARRDVYIYGDTYVDVNYGVRLHRSITISYDNTNGRLDPNVRTSYLEGQIAVITAYPHPGYRVKNWVIDGVDKPVDANLITDPLNQVTEYHLTMDKDYTVGVEFEQSIYNQSTSARYGTIQAAINAAQAFDVIVVGDGTYSGAGNVDLHFNMGVPVTVKSEKGSEHCIIDCSSYDGYAHRGFQFINAAGATLNNYIDFTYEVDGFTITNGMEFNGGGLYYEGRFYADNNEPAEPYPSPTVRNCIITNCYAFQDGGGVCFGTNKIPKVGEPPTPPAKGWPVTPVIEDCVIRNNSSGQGGGISFQVVIPIIISNQINNNFASGSGGGIYGAFSATGATSQKGGVANNLITFNNAGGFGGGIHFDKPTSEYEVKFNTIMYNTGAPVQDKSTGGISINKGSCKIDHTIIGRSAGSLNVWGHADSAGDDIYTVGGSADVTYSCIENGSDGEGNIKSNPLFTNGSLGNYYLSQAPGNQATSPCVNAGEPGALNFTQNTYGVSRSITTNMRNFTDSGLPDIGYHYPLYDTTDLFNRIHRTVVLNAVGNGSLDYNYPDANGTAVSGRVYGGSNVTIDVWPGTRIGLLAVPDLGNRVLLWRGTDRDYFPDYNFPGAPQNIKIDYVELRNSATVYAGTTTHTVTLTLEKSYKRTINAFTSGETRPDIHRYVGIQPAIDAARDGDEVVVNNGIYRNYGYRVFGKNIMIRCTNPDDPCIVAATIIDARLDINAPATYDAGGFTIAGDFLDSWGSSFGVGKGSCVLAGFTIRNQHKHWRDAHNGENAGDPGDDGGFAGSGLAGITLYGDHKVYNCVIKDWEWQSQKGGNGKAGKEKVDGGRGGNGGGAGGMGIFVVAGSPVISGCRIENCRVVAGSGGNGGNGVDKNSDGGRGGYAGRAMGGGVYISGGWTRTINNVQQTVVTAPTFNNCTFKNCRAVGGQGGTGGNEGDPDTSIAGYGGLCYLDPQQNWPSDYSAYGGAVYCASGSKSTFRNCIISDSNTTGSTSGLGGTGTGYMMPPAVHEQIPGFGGGIYCEQGSEATLQNCTINGNVVTYFGFDYMGYGGGICAEDVNVFAIRDCNITNNSASVGGGLYALAIGKTSLIEDCNIKGNSSFIGGGLQITDSARITISNCSISENTASKKANPDYTYGSKGSNDPNDSNDANVPPSQPALFFGAGGGIYCFTSDLFIADCNISRNDSDGSGGGVYIGGNPESTSPLGVLATPELFNCAIARNVAGRDGGGVSCNWESESILSNCTIAYNKVTAVGFGASYGGGLYVSYDSNCITKDSIIWGNASNNGSQIAVASGDAAEPLPSHLNITYSNIGPLKTETPVIINPNLESIRTGFEEANLPANDDGSTAKVDIGFTINFFGKIFSKLYVNNNGNVTFNAPMWTYTPFGLTTNIATPIIAPFFADVDTRVGNITTFGKGTVDGHRAFGVNWIEVGYFSEHVDKTNTFQLVLIERADRASGDFDIEFNYAQIEWEAGDVSGDAHNGLGGLSARAGFSNGTGEPGTFYELEGSGVHGAFLDSSSTGLINRSRHSTVGGRSIYYVESGMPEIPSGKIIYVAEGSTVDYWNEDTNSWTGSDHYNYGTDPLFVNGYYLSQVLSGQSVNSSCFDSGRNSVDLMGMYRHTTRTDWVIDTGVGDRGYHYVMPAMIGDFDVDGDVDFEDLAIFTDHYLDTGCISPGWCGGTDINRDGDVDLQDYTEFMGNIGTKENVPPLPSPMTFEVSPGSVYGQTYITMTANIATDNYTPSQQIQYYFQRTDAGGNPDGRIRDWSTDRVFTDTGLAKNATFGYRVKARDRAGNETAWSLIKIATVGIESNPPKPNPMTWDVEPYIISITTPNRVRMVATTATDESGGIEYYFECATATNHSSGWITTPQYEDSNLEPNTTYTYRVRARDRFDNRTAYSIDVNVRTPSFDPNISGDNTAPSPAPYIVSTAPTAPPAPQWLWLYDAVNGWNWHLILTSTIATDASGVVEYNFYCYSYPDLARKGVIWQTSNVYDCKVGAFQPAALIWQVAARDAAGNRTSYSAPTLVLGNR